MASFLDATGGLWMRGALNGKIGAAFTSTASQHGGQETTLFSIITNLLHLGTVIVGLDYGYKGQMGVDVVRGGLPYGATTVAAADGSRQPTDQGSRARPIRAGASRKGPPNSRGFPRDAI